MAKELSRDGFDVVTGAFGYSGRYITRLLLAQGARVKTLTGHPNRSNPFGDRVEIAPFNFDRPDELTTSLVGAACVINTYWIRFEYGERTYERAIANTNTLIEAAKRAGVDRFVHISITNPSEDSPLPYFRGKSILERALAASGLSYAIIRPTVIFGPEDILINNIAWLLRRIPMFAVPGTGDYRLQPIFVEDLANIVVDAARDDRDITLDAVGPESFTFDELLRLLARTVGSKARIVHVTPLIALALSKFVSWITRDITLTRDEVLGLMAGLLAVDGSPTGTIRLSDWLARNADRIGTEYASEIGRHYR